jgi:SAM-dependent methyltransferase
MTKQAKRNPVKIKAKDVIKSVASRLTSPRHIGQMVKLQRGRKAKGREYGDPQLELYAKILPGGFLHYGYFDDPDTQPRDISLNNIQKAQLRYAERLLAHVSDTKAPILDVGCGMGGLVKMMLERGWNPVALSPDAHQIEAVQRDFPGVEAIEARFEDMKVDEHRGRYGTIITSESVNYLDLDTAIPHIETLLQPGGRWVACDYFGIGDAKKRARAERWESFQKRIAESNFKITHEENITPHVMPTMRYVHLWGHDIARPVVDFVQSKMEQKQPAAHYLLSDVMKMLDQKIDLHLDSVNPDTFAATRQYMLLVMEAK